MDFTSALYLGIRHSTRVLRPWSQLTTGKPAALETTSSTDAVAETLAHLQGCERGVLLPSTLHLFFDLFEVLRPLGIRIYADAGTYPIAIWGAERAASRGVLLQRIPHYHAAAARTAIEEDERTRLRPVIVADGFCPGCGRPAPLREYLQCVTPYNGYVVLDDTQALGIWGTDPNPDAPYGSGGGGSLRLHGLRSRHVILGSSLAKGFGVPLAVLSGSARVVQRFVAQAETLVHVSPPSIAALYAAEHALAVNSRGGDEIRLRLLRLVRKFHEGLRGTGLFNMNNLFPVQMLTLRRQDEVLQLQRRLSCADVQTAITRPALCSSGLNLVFIIRASHSSAAIDCAVRALLLALDESVP